MAFVFTGKRAFRERFMMNRAAKGKKAPRKRVFVMIVMIFPIQEDYTPIEALLRVRMN